MTPKERGKIRKRPHAEFEKHYNNNRPTVTWKIVRLGFQAVAPSEQVTADGDGQHGGQTTPDGRQETQRSKVCAHGVRPGNGAFKSRERKSKLHSLQFYIEF